MKNNEEQSASPVNLLKWVKTWAWVFTHILDNITQPQMARGYLDDPGGATAAGECRKITKVSILILASMPLPTGMPQPQGGT